MNILTKQQRERIAPWEHHLHSAFYADYVVAMSSGAANDLFAVYNEVFNANESNRYCNSCVLNVCKRLGRLYYEEQPEEKEEVVYEEVSSGIGPDDDTIVHQVVKKKQPAKPKKKK